MGPVINPTFVIGVAVAICLAMSGLLWVTRDRELSFEVDVETDYEKLPDGWEENHWPTTQKMAK